MEPKLELRIEQRQDGRGRRTVRPHAHCLECPRTVSYNALRCAYCQVKRSQSLRRVAA